MAKNIMIVDDDPDVICIVKQVLENSGIGYNVIPVDSGEKCLELLKNNQIPDLILLDIAMPGMTGWATFGNIRDNLSWRDIPIVFLTGRTDRMARDAGCFLGEAYIEKPFDVTDLKERIEEVLNMKNIG